MKTTVTWGPGDTWRKVGYLTYFNSLDYKYALQQNPQWNMTETPPVGTVIELSTNGMTAGVLNAVSPFWDQPSEAAADFYFPFENATEYESRVAQYSFYALANSNELNGYSSDSESAVRGLPQVTIR